MCGRLGVNFFPPTATSDVAGPPRTGLFLIEVGVIRIESAKFSCFVVRPVALDVPVDGGDCVVQVLTLLCVILYYYLLPSLSLRLLLFKYCYRFS